MTRCKVTEERRGCAHGACEPVRWASTDDAMLALARADALARESDGREQRTDRLRLRWGYRSDTDRRFGALSGEPASRELRLRFAALLALGPAYSYSIESGKGGPAVAALLLARAEQAGEAAGWTVDFEPDQEAAAEEGAPRWAGLVYSAEGEQQFAIGAYDFGDEQPDPREGFGRLAAAELLLDAGVLEEARLAAPSEACRAASAKVSELAEKITELAFSALEPGDERHHPAHHELLELGERLTREADRLADQAEEAQR